MVSALDKIPSLYKPAIDSKTGRFTDSWRGWFQLLSSSSVDTLSTMGFVIKRSGDLVTRSIEGTINSITVTNGDGLLNDPQISISSTYAGQNTITTVGVLSTGSWNADTISVSHGGTGAASFTEYGVICGGTSTTSPLQSISPGSSGHVLTSNGASALPSFQAVGTVGTLSGFAAYRATTQSIPNNTITKVQINTEEFDLNNDFDSTTNFRHTPTIAGVYHYTGTVTMTVESDLFGIGAHLIKNGSVIKTRVIQSTFNAVTSGVSIDAYIEMNGSSDYMELGATQINTSTNNINTFAGSLYTFFCGMRVPGT